MKTLAAVLVKTGKPLVLEELEIPPLKPGQVLVEVSFSGVCHTQVLECRGYRGEDKFLPHCLGHEGSGKVIEIGKDVTKVKRDDLVILSWIKGSGADVSATYYQSNSRLVNAGGITTFSRHSIISENRLTVIPDDIDISLPEAAMVGCVVPTGVGAVFNTANPSASQNIAIFGVGGVGLCAVAAASIIGCKKIIAIDIADDKLNAAKKMGATHFINAYKNDPVKEINNFCPGGVDFSIEASGHTSAMLQALSSVHSRGGSTVVIGNARYGEKIQLDPSQLNQGKRLLGTWGGDSLPDRHYPEYCRLISCGKLNLKPLFSRFYSLSEINQAINDLEAGEVIRPLVDLSL